LSFLFTQEKPSSGMDNCYNNACRIFWHCLI